MLKLKARPPPPPLPLLLLLLVALGVVDVVVGGEVDVVEEEEV
jgi:hypothetical protein